MSDKWYISGPLGIGETEPYAPLVVSGEISLKSPDSGIHSLRFKRTDEENRTHEWALWHMNKDYRKNALEIWEYRTDSSGKSCDGNPADGAMCALRLVILEGGNVGIANELTVGTGGNAVLRTRHIEGKHGDNDDPDTLYLNWVSGKDVQIGEPTRRSNLAVLGNVGIGTTASDAPLEIQGGTKGKFQIGRGNLAFEGGNEGGNLHIESREGMYLNFYSNKPIFFGTGNVGIGTTNLTSKLHVAGNAGILSLEGTDHAYIQWYPDGLSAGRKAWIGFGSAGDNSLTIANEIQGGTIQVLGDLRLGGSLYLQSHRTRLLGFDGQPGFHWIQTQDDENKMWIGFRQDGNGNPEWLEVGPPIRGRLWTNSDVRLKDNIVQLTNVLDKFQALRGVQFEWKDSKASGCVAGRRDIGVIAQEVQAAFPELVVTSGTEGYKAVNYTGLIGAIIEAIKALRAETIVLRQELNALTTSR